MISFGRAPCDEGVIRAAADTPGCAARARPWVLAATILGSSMAFIDGSVVTVALPAIQADLTTSVAGAQWVANAYMLMLGALILAGGAAGDRFGRRRVFALGSLLGLRIGAEHRNSDRRSGGAGRRWRASNPRQPCDHQRSFPGR
jgi:hypothetical protein